MLSLYLIIGLVFVAYANTSALLDGSYARIPHNLVGVLVGIPILYAASIFCIAVWPFFLIKDAIKAVGGDE